MIAIVAYRRAARGRGLVAVLLLAGALAIAGALFGVAAYQAYQATNTWTFGYTLDIQGNGTGPESLIVPIPTDEGLLAGLQRTDGIANWSFVDTSHGRGLFVRFTGSATFRASMSLFPPPQPVPDATPTLPVRSNCTAQPSNCTGPPEVWIWYSGSAGAFVWLSLDSWFVQAHPAPGWGTYERWAAPVPMM